MGRRCDRRWRVPMKPCSTCLAGWAGRPALLLRGCLPLVREEALNLFDRVVDLDVEGHLAECRGRAARIAGDAVVFPRRRVGIRLPATATARAEGRCRIAFGGRDK